MIIKGNYYLSVNGELTKHADIRCHLIDIHGDTADTDANSNRYFCIGGWICFADLG